MEKLGLSYDKICPINPSMIYCSVSGFGQYGPYSQFVGYDVVFQAMSGLMSVTGEEDGGPLRVGLPITDIFAALYASYSVCWRCIIVKKLVQASILTCHLSNSSVEVMGQLITTYASTRKLPRRFGNIYPYIAPYEPVATSDGTLVIA